jgi:hypothetical protein
MDLIQVVTLYGREELIMIQDLSCIYLVATVYFGLSHFTKVIAQHAPVPLEKMIFVTQQRHEQIKSILAVPKLSDRIIKDKKMPADVRALFVEIKKDPKSLDKKTAQVLKDIAELKQQALGRCRLAPTNH